MPNPDSGGTWGVLGGSFDPVHNGHINLANNICKAKNLIGVLLVPSFNHPLKKENAVESFENRNNLLQLALETESQLSVSAIEKELNLSGYTIDTLQALKKRFPNSEFYFIIGADLIEQLDKWHRSEELLKEFKFLAGGRPGVKIDKIRCAHDKSIELVEIMELDISASDIRARIKGGATKNDLLKLLPSKVAQYIFEKKLYQ